MQAPVLVVLLAACAQDSLEEHRHGGSGLHIRRGSLGSRLICKFVGRTKNGARPRVVPLAADSPPHHRAG